MRQLLATPTVQILLTGMKAQWPVREVAFLRFTREVLLWSIPYRTWMTVSNNLTQIFRFLMSFISEDGIIPTKARQMTLIFGIQRSAVEVRGPDAVSSEVDHISQRDFFECEEPLIWCSGERRNDEKRHTTEHLLGPYTRSSPCII